MSDVDIRCYLCFKKSEKQGNDLIWKDSLQLCPKCYEKYMESPYNQRCMLLNSVKCYRKLIRKYDDSSPVHIETDFQGIS